MTRISDRLLVRRSDDLIVVIDESAGEEVAFPVELTARVIVALGYLAKAEVTVSTGGGGDE